MPSGPQQFFVDAAGRYLGSFTGFQRPNDVAFDREGEPVVKAIFPYEMPPLPAGAIEVPFPPQDGRDVWSFATGSYVPHVPVPKKPDLDALVQALLAKGVITAAELEGKP